MNLKYINEILPGRWMHSHEEDNEGSLVFRPASFHFPRSRGRSGFELKPDHALIEIRIGSADCPVEQNGQWELDELGCLKLEHDNEIDTLQIVSAEKDRLVVKRR